jgi:hypothetical protein
LLPLLGPDVKDVKTIHGYPDRLDFESRMVDFQQKGAVCRWLWLAFPSETRIEHDDVTGGWLAAGDVGADWTFAQAISALEKNGLKLSIEMPPFAISDAPLIGVWWYRRKITLPAQNARAWLRLPKGLFEPRIWINGRELDLKKRWKLAELMPLDVEIPSGSGREVEVVLRTEAGIKQYAEKNVGSFHGKAAVMIPSETVPAVTASYRDGMVSITAGSESWRVPHTLMSAEEKK